MIKLFFSRLGGNKLQCHLGHWRRECGKEPELAGRELSARFLWPFLQAQWGAWIQTSWPYLGKATASCREGNHICRLCVCRDPAFLRWVECVKGSCLCTLWSGWEVSIHIWGIGEVHGDAFTGRLRPKWRADIIYWFLCKPSIVYCTHFLSKHRHVHKWTLYPRGTVCVLDTDWPGMEIHFLERVLDYYESNSTI